jgi:hypothetical protein
LIRVSDYFCKIKSLKIGVSSDLEYFKTFPLSSITV